MFEPKERSVTNILAECKAEMSDAVDRAQIYLEEDDD